ncbi:preprotein translocase subunit SecE [Candidatus Latescibacterota bacterium]
MAKITEKTVKYFREVKIEMSKVAWPSWSELKGSTILVIILSAFFAIYVGGVDLLLSIVSRVF